MNEDVIIDITNRAIRVTAMLSAPLLLGALFIGIIISIFQAVTQINEQTLSFIPKMLVIMGTMVIFGPWMLQVITSYSREIFLSIPSMVGNK